MTMTLTIERVMAFMGLDVRRDETAIEHTIGIDNDDDVSGRFANRTVAADVAQFCATHARTFRSLL